MPGLTKAEQAREIKRLTNALLAEQNECLDAIEKATEAESDAAKWRALEEYFSVKHRVKPPFVVAIEQLTGVPT